MPRLAEDLGTLRSTRRLRGLREWHPRLVIGLLVRAIRHADQLAIAMDARGFGTGRRLDLPTRPLDSRSTRSSSRAAIAILVAVLVVAR